MNSGTLEALVSWIGEHPIAAGALIFLIAFGDALVIVGIVVPAVPLLFAVGTLVGLGHVDGNYAIACAALGAFCGDGLSFWIGRRYGTALRQRWPFSHHPQWLDRGEAMLRRHGMKAILIARYVGAVRPFVPAIAGMLHLHLRRYAPASVLAAAAWAATFIAPGWVLGASLELVAAVAGRLAVVIGLLLLVLAAIWSTVFYLWRALAPRTAELLERALAWSHRHPVLGRYSEALIDPHRPESASLALMALGLIAAGWALFSLLIALAGQGEPLALDLMVHQAMFALRNPLADDVMAVLASLAAWPVLVPASALVFVWLLWRKRHSAAWHWLAALGFGLVLTTVLGYALDMPKPPAATAVSGFSFPSVPVTMATVVFGFFAVLIARELPGRRRAWPYVVAGLTVTIIGFARLYLGAHWLSDVLAAILLGLAWIALLGIAYRRRVVRSFWVRPIALVFFGTFVLAGAWHGPHSAQATLSRYDPPLMQAPLTLAAWWQDDWERGLPARRNELRGADAWPLNVQYAGRLETLQARLEAAGWQRLSAGGWSGLLMTLDDDASAAILPILPATHQGHAESLMMMRPGATPGQREVLRLWAAPYVLEPGATPLWIGTVHSLRFIRRLDFVSYWEAQADDRTARSALRGSVDGLPLRESRRSDVDIDVIRLREPELDVGRGVRDASR